MRVMLPADGVRHAVVIAGGGPTGLMLAGELALAGVDVALVERRHKQELVGSRAGGLHARTIEVLDQRGIADRFLSQGRRSQSVGFNMIRLDVSDFPTRHNYVLGLWQNHIERILADWVGELGVPIYRGQEVSGFAQDHSGVEVELSDGQRVTADYLVGCDGGRSVIRKAAGIDFAGWDSTMSWMIAEVEMSEEPASGFRSDAYGIHAMGKTEEGGPVRVVLTERQLSTGGEPTLRDLSEALTAVYGTDYGVHSPTWISRFTDMTRQAAAYRDGRVLLAGDAAHVHPPMGGQGLNIGVQDAVNLGWKLAQVVSRTAPEGLLDSYHAERHPVAARALRNTMAQVALRRMDDRTKALGDTVAELLGMDEPRKRIAAEMSGLGVHYNLGEGHPLLGRRMPDLDLVTTNGPLRLFSFLHDARPMFLNLGEPGTLDIAPWADRVRQIDARYAGAWELPVLGTVAAPEAVLIRPDGYVAWVRVGTQQGLADALTTWFGPPVAN
ncbi:FAD-dependent monooxygenase [Mesorhizobium sp. Mes31]|uniref:FAD-dependent monooxygenase n=1 Tax=Mesorhizobium sp. Mes31 TaxID=2926017 RepID=UPI00211742B1|nr:FAD-dependent monooxygenase [Mesorhizobium sp. Mes31]